MSFHWSLNAFAIPTSTGRTNQVHPPGMLANWTPSSAKIPSVWWLENVPRNTTAGASCAFCWIWGNRTKLYQLEHIWFVLVDVGHAEGQDDPCFGDVLFLWRSSWAWALCHLLQHSSMVLPPSWDAEGYRLPTQLLPLARYGLEEPPDEILVPDITGRQLWITSFTRACECFQSESRHLLQARQAQQDIFHAWLNGANNWKKLYSIHLSGPFTSILANLHSLLHMLICIHRWPGHQ